MTSNTTIKVAQLDLQHWHERALALGAYYIAEFFFRRKTPRLVVYYETFPHKGPLCDALAALLQEELEGASLSSRDIRKLFDARAPRFNELIIHCFAVMEKTGTSELSQFRGGRFADLMNSRHESHRNSAQAWREVASYLLWSRKGRTAFMATAGLGFSLGTIVAVGIFSSKTDIYSTIVAIWGLSGAMLATIILFIGYLPRRGA